MNPNVTTNKIQRVIDKQKRRIQLETLVILTLVVGLGWGCSVGLFHWGLKILWVRYLISATLAYGIFLPLYWWWMKQVIQDLAENLNYYDRETAPNTAKKDPSDWFPDISFDFDLEAIGILVGILAILVTVIVVVLTAPAMLVDLIGSELLLIFITKRITSLEQELLFLGIFRHTVVPFLFLATVIALWGFGLQAYFPGRESLSAIIFQH